MNAIKETDFFEISCHDGRNRRYPYGLALVIPLVFKERDPGLITGALEIADTNRYPALDEPVRFTVDYFGCRWPGFNPVEDGKTIAAVMAGCNATARYWIEAGWNDLRTREPVAGLWYILTKYNKRGTQVRKLPSQFARRPPLPQRDRSKHGWESMIVGDMKFFTGVSRMALTNSFNSWARSRHMIGARVTTETLPDGAVMVTRIS